MSLPNLSGPVGRWSQNVTIKTVTVTKVNFVETKHITVAPFKAVVQPADKEKLNPASIDWSREYLWFHSLSPMALGQYIQYKGEDFKLITEGNYSDYGYYEIVGEQTKLALLVATP